MDINKVERLKFWCQKVLPLVYDESLSYYELLCKVVDYLNKIITNQGDIINVIDEHEADIVQLQKDVKWLYAELAKIKNGGYMDVYIQALINWIDANIQQLVGRIVKYVYFGLTDDGYFVAYIPPTWDFISFDTIMDYNSQLYGHLVLQW